MYTVGVFLLLPGWDPNPSHGYAPALSLSVPIYTPGWREKVFCPITLHNVLAWAQTRTVQSGDEQANHEARFI